MSGSPVLFHYVTGCSYFTYKGVRYGEGTKIRFNQQFYDSRNKKHRCYEKVEILKCIEDGGKVWHCGQHITYERYEDVVPDRDIYGIVKPYYYYVPKELVQERLRDGTWILYIWPQTLFYTLCLIVSPIFQEWYLIWTIGLYAYLRLSYIALSKP